MIGELNYDIEIKSSALRALAMEACQLIAEALVLKIVCILRAVQAQDAELGPGIYVRELGQYRVATSIG